MSRYHLSKNYVPGTVCRDGKLLSIHEVVDELNRLAEQLADARRDVAEANDARQVAVDARLAAEERELALAAHVKRSQEAGEQAVNGFSLRGLGDTYEAADLAAVLRDAPETSLAKLKAQWQAAKLDELMALIGAGAAPSEVTDWLVSESDELRRQAEGDN